MMLIYRVEAYLDAVVVVSDESGLEVNAEKPKYVGLYGHVSRW
jgi:hypothetical protein